MPGYWILINTSNVCMCLRYSDLLDWLANGMHPRSGISATMYFMYVRYSTL